MAEIMETKTGKARSGTGGLELLGDHHAMEWLP
jgi:hypothetical protein